MQDYQQGRKFPGQAGGFGAATPGFGQQQQPAAGGFGAASTPGAFGAGNTTSALGGFGAGSSGFGGAATSGFGTATGAFGAAPAATSKSYISFPMTMTIYLLFFSRKHVY